MQVAPIANPQSAGEGVADKASAVENVGKPAAGRGSLALNLTIGLALVSLVTVATALMGLYSLNGFRSQFDDVVDQQLPAIIAASRLSQQSESIIADAPSLVVSRTHADRRSVRLQIQDKVNWIDEVIDELSRSGVATARLQTIKELKQKLIGNLETLDQLVTTKIDNDRQLTQTGSRLEALFRKLAAVAPTSRSASEAAWFDSADQRARVLASTTQINHGHALTRLEEELAALNRAADQLNVSMSAEAAEIERELDALIFDPAGLIDLQRTKVETDNAIRITLSDSRTVSQKLVSSASEMVREVERDVVSKNEGFGRLAERWLSYSIGLFLLCAICLAASTAYVRKKIIHRLAALQRRIQPDRPTEEPIPAAGDLDEIGDIARAFDRFQTRILKRELELKQSEEKFSRIFQKSPDPMMIVRRKDARIIEVNPAFEGYFGFSRSEAVGRSTLELGLWADLNERTKFVQMLDRDGEVSSLEFMARMRSGERRTCQISSKPIRLGDMNCTLSMVHDISERKEFERSLMRAHSEAQAANRAKTVFLAKMSHELRTPLNAILGFSEVIRKRLFGAEAADKYAEYADNIHTSGQRLLTVINHILDVSQIATSQRILSPVHLDISKAFSEVVEEFHEQLQGKRQTTSIDVAEDATWLYADEGALHQILRNLVENAVAYTQIGGAIRLQSRSSVDGTAISVIDNGRGIDPDAMERIAQPFEQEEQEAFVASEGAGLGLHLAKSLVELHHGTLRIESVFGKGTTVTMFFPAPAR